MNPAFRKFLHQKEGIKVEREIGHGKESTVYRATITELGGVCRPCAVKVYTHEKLLDQRRLNELKNLCRMHASNYVVRLLRTIEKFGFIALILEWCDQSFASMLQYKQQEAPGTGFSRKECYTLFSQIAHGLSHCHSFELWHGDVKPANMLINNMGHAKVSDFGMARIQSSGTSMTSFGGSPSFMLPQHEVKLTQDRDLFGFALSYAFMRLGQHPFKSEHPATNEFDLAGLDQDEIDLLTPLLKGNDSSEKDVVAWFQQFNPQQIVVPCMDFPTISSAMQDALPLTTIHVLPGIYEETIQLKQSVRLIGVDRNKCIIRLRTGETSALRVESITEGSIEQLTFEGCDPTERQSDRAKSGHFVSGIMIADSVLTVRDCTFRDFNAGVAARGVSTEVTIIENICEHNDVGLIVSSECAATIMRNICRQNKATGILVMHYGDIETAAVTVIDNVCEDNSRTGISVTGGRTATVRNNVCRQNGEDGIEVTGNKASVSLIHNRCEDNGDSGIAVTEGAAAIIHSNACRSNKSFGIVADEKLTSVKLIQNECEENSDSGIGIFGGAAATIQNNACRRNEWFGIVARDEHTSVNLVHNTCEENEYCGIALLRDVRGIAQHNVCRRSRRSPGIYVEARSSIAASHNIEEENILLQQSIKKSDKDNFILAYTRMHFKRAVGKYAHSLID